VVIYLADNEADQHQQHHRHTQQYGVDSHAGYGHQQNVRQAPKQQRPGVKSPIMDDATNSGYSRRGRLFDMIQDVSTQRYWRSCRPNSFY
jgi:hypothetical protein